MAGVVANTVRCGQVPTSCEAFQHVAEVADEDTRRGRDPDPRAVAAVHLEAAERILGEHGEQAVVRVFGDAPLVEVVERNGIESSAQREIKLQYLISEDPIACTGF